MRSLRSGINSSMLKSKSKIKEQSEVNTTIKKQNQQYEHGQIIYNIPELVTLSYNVLVHKVLSYQGDD
jgi:hypothetical protein